MPNETEYIYGKCPFCGEEIESANDLEDHQWHGDSVQPCSKCGKWVRVHLIATFQVTADKEMQDYIDNKKPVVIEQ